MRIFWTIACSFSGAPMGSETMGILAINTMNLEGQGETAAVTRATSELQANGDFATELGRKLQVQTNPALASGVSEPECAPGKGSSSKDGNRSRRAGGNSTVSLAAIVTALSVTSPGNSIAGNRATPNPEQAATVNSDSLTGSSPEEIASTFAKNSAQPANDEGEETAKLRGGKTDETGVSVQAALQNEAARKPNLNAGILSEEATQVSTSSLKPGAPQDKSSKAPSANKAVSAEDNSTAPPSCLAQTLAMGQDGSANTAGSMSERVDAVNVTSPSRSGIRVQSSGVETRAPSQKVEIQLEPPNSSSGPITSGEWQSESGPESQFSARDVTGLHAQITTHGRQSRAVWSSIPLELAMTQSTLAKADASQAKDSKASSANEAAAAEVSSTMQPSQAPQVVTVGQEGSTLVTGSVPTPPRVEALHATRASSLDEELQGAAVESPAKTDSSEDKRKQTTVPAADKRAPAEASSTLQLSQASQVVTTGQEASVSAKGAAPTWERIEATSPSNLSKGLQATGVEIHAALHQGTAQLEPRDSSSTPEARPRQQAESGPESPSRPQDALDPDVQASIAGPISPDFSLSMPIELTKEMSIGRLDVPQNSNRIQNSQDGKSSTSGNDNKADLGVTETSLLQQPVQTSDRGRGAPNKDGEASPDTTKMADGKGGLPKANSDPPLASQFIPEGRAEAGRASPGAIGASQGPGAPGSASVFQGYRADAETVVRSARFTQQTGNAEMQVRLRSEALGPIDVHTIVKGSDIGASIRVEGRDTQVMLANELSQLERALNEHSLRVDHLDVLQGSVSGGQSTGTGPGNSEGSSSEPRPSFSGYSTGQTYTSLPEPPTVSEDWGLGLSTTRLNLRV